MQTVTGQQQLGDHLGRRRLAGDDLGDGGGTVLFQDAWALGLQKGEHSVFWNFSNRWTSADGTRAALVYTGPSADNFGVLTVEFRTG